MECETQETHTSPFLSTPFVLVLFSLPKVESQLHPVPFLTTRFSFFCFFLLSYSLLLFYTFLFFLLPQSLKPKKEGGRLVGFLERTISTLYSSQQGRSLSFTLCLSVEYIVFLFLFSLFNLYINSSVSPSLSLSRFALSLL